MLSSLQSSVREEALYESRQVGFCPIDDERAAKATATVDWPEKGALTLTVSVPSGRSTRQLSRTLDLGSVPPDGYALTIGSSLGELLREARRELPGLKAVEPELAPTWGLGVALGGEAFTGGQTHGGADVFLRRRFGARFALEIEAGVRVALPTEAPNGTINALSIAGGLHGLFDLLQLGRLAIRATAGRRDHEQERHREERAHGAGSYRDPASPGNFATRRASGPARARSWYSRRVMRFRPYPLLLGFLTATCLLGVSACLEKVNSCDRYADFETALGDRCELAWDCEIRFPELPPATAQDLDWCVDCVTLQLTGEATGLACDPAPLSGQPCAAVLNDTLDSSCFPLDATSVP